MKIHKVFQKAVVRLCIKNINKLRKTIFAGKRANKYEDLKSVLQLSE